MFLYIHTLCHCVIDAVELLILPSKGEKLQITVTGH